MDELSGLYFVELDDVVVGMFDIQARQRDMNTLKQLPVGVARALYKAGKEAIDKARSVAQAKHLPGETARDQVYWKLAWHDAELSKSSATDAMYTPGDDLKRWVMQAFIEANAVEEGASWIDQVWARMWEQIKSEIAKLPPAIAAKINETAGELFGLPMWAVLGGSAAIGLGILALTRRRA